MKLVKSALCPQCKQQVYPNELIKKRSKTKPTVYVPIPKADYYCPYCHTLLRRTTSDTKWKVYEQVGLSLALFYSWLIMPETIFDIPDKYDVIKWLILVLIYIFWFVCAFVSYRQTLYIRR